MAVAGCRAEEGHQPDIQVMGPSQGPGACMSFFNPLPCLKEIVGGAKHAVGSVVGDVAGSVWDSICKSFYDACMSLLASFANAFTTFADPDIHSIWNVYAISLTLGMIVCLVLVCVQAGAAAQCRSR
jgi:hypothetical protein